MKISVVIAAFNEADNIGPLTSHLISTLDGFENSEWEWIYVIDGTDGTFEVAQGFAAIRPEIRILHSAKPSGLAGAFRRRFQVVSAESDLVVTMDADLNHQPEEPRLVAALFSREAGLVVGSRKGRGKRYHGSATLETNARRHGQSNHATLGWSVRGRHDLRLPNVFPQRVRSFF